MKTIYKKITVPLFALLILLGACTKLDEDPTNVLTQDDLSGSPEVLDALAAPVYTRLTEVMFGWHGYFDLQEESSDEIVTPARPNGWVDGGTYRALHMHTWNAFQSQPGGLWNRVYGALNILNSSLNTYKSVQGTEKVIGELRAMRALYYYLLLDNFGNVPIVTETDIVKKDFVPTQSTRAQVFDFVEKELLEVIPELSEEKVYGKMNKWGARMILAKIYLNAGVYLGQPMWDKALAQVNEIEQAGYMLEANYHNNFATTNENSTEQIFSIVFDEKKAGWLHYHWKTLHPSSQATYNLGTSPWGGSCAIPQFIDTYDPDDNRFQIWIKGPQFASNGDPVYNSMDPALSTVQLNYTNELISVDETKEYQGYRVGKFEIQKGSIGPLSNDVPLFRYADALMIKAECLLRTGRADEAAAIVTQIRQRAFPNHPEKAIVTGAELMQGSKYPYGTYKNGKIVTMEGGADIQYGRFFDELGYEFAAEFHRRQDMIRFGVFTRKSWLSHVPNGDHRILFPIPQSARDANPNLKQNDGY